MGAPVNLEIVAPEHWRAGMHRTSAAAWEDLLDALRAAAGVIEGDDGARTEIEAAEGYRFALRLLSAGLDLYLENGSPAHPTFTRLMTPTRKFFGDSPDTLYDYAPISGTGSYLLTGTRGTVAYLAICIYGGSKSGRNRIIANLSDRDFDINDDGTFQIALDGTGAEQAAPNRIALADDATAVVVRQYLLDRVHEVPATYNIARTDSAASGPPPHLSEAHLARRLRAIGGFVQAAALATATVAGRTRQDSLNEMKEHGADAVAEFFPTPDNLYVAAWYSIDEGEALIVEATPPDARYWAIVLMNRWMESLDHRYRQVILNKMQAAAEPDGSYRFVVSCQDPFVPNWLDASGHPEGYVMFRWMQAPPAPLPVLRVVPLDDVRHWSAESSRTQ